MIIVHKNGKETNCFQMEGILYDINVKIGKNVNFDYRNARFENKGGCAQIINIGNNTTIETPVTIGAGSRIGRGVFIGEGSNIGGFCKIGSNSVLEGFNFINDYVSIHSNVIVGNFVNIVANCTVESYAELRCSISSGKRIIIGAGKKSLKDFYFDEYRRTLYTNGVDTITGEILNIFLEMYKNDSEILEVLKKYE